MRPTALTPEQARAAHALYWNGMSYAEVGVRFHCCRETLRQSFRALGLPLRGPGMCVRKYSRRSALSPDAPYALYVLAILRDS